MKKKILLTLITTLLSIALQSQSFLELYKQYKDYCREIVLDTAYQIGIIKLEKIPVLIQK